MPANTEIEIVTCEHCAGQGTVDDIEGKPWTRFDPAHAVRLRNGTASPRYCPKCQGKKTIEREVQPLPDPQETEPAEDTPATNQS
jgi:DnaJ-class molecular chaperone